MTSNTGLDIDTCLKNGGLDINNIEIFRPKSALLASIFGYMLLLGAILQSVITENLEDLILTVLVCALIGLFVYSIIQRPKLIIGDEGVTIINPLSSKHLHWHEVVEIETRYALTFYTNQGTFTSWAALAPTRYHHRNIHPSELKGMVRNNTNLIRASDSPRADSGAAAFIARQRWELFVRNHPH